MNNFNPQNFTDAALEDSLHAMRANIQNSRTDRMLRPHVNDFKAREQAILAEMEKRNLKTDANK